MKHVVITGASTGIGRATTEHLLAHGYHVFGSVRREADAAVLQAQLGQNFTPLLFDVTDTAAVNAAAEKVSSLLNGEGLSGLINNAGIGIGGPLMHQPLAEVRQVLDVNVLGTLAVTQAFLPLLGARIPRSTAPGRIINISSVAGKITLPFLGAYAASKHAVEALSDAMRRELMLYGIEVSIVEPGAVRTPIWDKAEQEDVSHYQQTDYADIAARFQRYFIANGRAGLAPEKVARTIREILETQHPRARYALPDHLLANWLIPRWLPAKRLDRLIARQLGLTPHTT